MIMWAAKWHGARRIYQMDERGGTKEMFEGIAHLISEADMVVTYNGDSFDLPWINGGVVQHGLPPLPPVASLDLYKTVKKLRYQSSKLAYVAPLLQIGEKVKNAGWELWAKVAAGDEKAWKEMARYNRGDVKLLDDGYNRLRPYVKNHPRLHPKQKGVVTCSVCGSGNLQFGRGTYSTAANVRERYVCLEPGCGKWGSIPLKAA
jgi:hypothetical protein